GCQDHAGSGAASGRTAAILWAAPARSPCASRLNGRMLPQPDPVLAAALAADLRAAGYTSEALRAAWTPTGDDALARGRRGVALAARGERSDPLAVLARLLGLGVAQPRADVDAALPACGADGLVGLGLAEITGAAVTPAALLRP